MSARTNPRTNPRTTSAAHGLVLVAVLLAGVVLALQVLAEATTPGGLYASMGVLAGTAWLLVQLDLQAPDRDRRRPVRAGVAR